MKKILSIAGFDGSGGAGIQADLKTFSAFGCYGMSVLTALPVQNTRGVKSCYEIPSQAIQEQLETIFEDIVPDCIKIGMLFTKDIIHLVSTFLQNYAAKIPIVLDPVMVAKSGDTLLQDDAVDALKTSLLPLVTIVTPNLPESSGLTGLQVSTKEDMPDIARKILSFGTKAVLLKGGHLEDNEATDFYINQDGSQKWLSQPKIITRNSHGTGCTLSAAIAAGLGLGMTLLEACAAAKIYLHRALGAAQHLSIGKGHGPVHHFYHLWPTIDKITQAV